MTSTIAFYPPAFSAAAQARLHALFPDAIVVGSADAYVLGLNVVSDGLHVVLPSAATGFAAQLREAGFEPVGVDLSELLKGGGSVKCCTLEVFDDDSRRRRRSANGTETAIELVERHAAHNYSPLPVVAASAEGAWITDVDGRRYLDCLAAYSAVNFGHRNPEIIATAHAQLDTVTLVSRAFHSDTARAVLRRTRPTCAAKTWCCR